MKAVFCKEMSFDVTEMAKYFLSYKIDNVFRLAAENADDYENLDDEQRQVLKMVFLHECINILEKEAEKTLDK